jgi:hypothetical protein
VMWFSSCRTSRSVTSCGVATGGLPTASCCRCSTIRVYADSWWWVPTGAMPCAWQSTSCAVANPVRRRGHLSHTSSPIGSRDEIPRPSQPSPGRSVGTTDLSVGRRTATVWWRRPPSHSIPWPPGSCPPSGPVRSPTTPETTGRRCRRSSPGGRSARRPTNRYGVVVEAWWPCPTFSFDDCGRPAHRWSRPTG